MYNIAFVLWFLSVPIGLIASLVYFVRSTMREKDPALLRRKAKETFLGSLVILVAGFVYFGRTIDSDTAPKERPVAEAAGPDQDIARFNSMTAGSYATANTRFLDAVFPKLVAELGVDATEAPHYRNCVGELAFSKDPKIAMTEILTWCDNERKTNYQVFVGHFNETEAGDLSIDAYLACKFLVKARLKAPSTADFPFLDYSAYRQGQNRYIVTSYVDAQNGFGAMLRTNYRCDLQLREGGRKVETADWRVISIEFN